MYELKLSSEHLGTKPHPLSGHTLPMTSRLTVLSMGRGSERKVKGSKRTLVYWQVLQVTSDFNCKNRTKQNSLQPHRVIHFDDPYLSLEEVHNDALVSGQVVVPSFSSHLLIWSTITVAQLLVGLVLDSSTEIGNTITISKQPVTGELH